MSKAKPIEEPTYTFEPHFYVGKIRHTLIGVYHSLNDIEISARSDMWFKHTYTIKRAEGMYGVYVSMELLYPETKASELDYKFALAQIVEIMKLCPKDLYEKTTSKRHLFTQERLIELSESLLIQLRGYK